MSSGEDILNKGSLTETGIAREPEAWGTGIAIITGGAFTSNTVFITL